MSVRISVEMWAFAQPRGTLRYVTIPDVPPFAETTQEQQLAAVFQYGQNDFACREDLAQQLPSVSVGDIIQLPTGTERCTVSDCVHGPRRFIVMPDGFKEVPVDFKVPEHDRAGMYAYALL